MSDFVDDIEDSDNTVSSSHGKHVSWIAEVNSEASSAEVSDLRARLEKRVTIKYLNFIASTTSCNDEVSWGFLELGCVHLAGIRGC